MTYGILRSRKYSDETYITYEKNPQNSAEYHTLKNDLHVFNLIENVLFARLKQIIALKCFAEKNKSRINSIWKIYVHDHLWI